MYSVCTRLCVARVSDNSRAGFPLPPLLVNRALRDAQVNNQRSLPSSFAPRGNEEGEGQLRGKDRRGWRGGRARVGHRGEQNPSSEDDVAFEKRRKKSIDPHFEAEA